MKINKSKKKRKVQLQIASTMRFPKNYQWKLLAALKQDLCQFLTEEENILLNQIIRIRSFKRYTEDLEDWGLQGINSSGVYRPELVAKYQLASFLKKYQESENEELCKAAALEKFVAAEQTCIDYNNTGILQLINSSDANVRAAYTYACEFIQKVLGNEPDEEVTIWSRHGPGSTVDTHSGLTSSYHKFEAWPYACSTRAIGKAVKVISEDERWYKALTMDVHRRLEIPMCQVIPYNVFWKLVLKVTDFNKVTFVPKSAVTHRTIAIEPTMNLYLQLGVDGLIRRRLKRWGIDLDDQTKNQTLAGLGSRNGAYATLDLAAASDTVSLAVCKALLPPEWYSYLMDLRVPIGTRALRGSKQEEKYVYNKISSMGNGYTFALESLIFAAISFGVQRTLTGQYDKDHIAIFGDDIVVPTDQVDLTVTVLRAAGFALNSDKSFTTGNVRESCGADWFNGISIRPIFLKHPPKTVKDLFSDHNRLKRFFELKFGIKSSYACAYLINMIPPCFLGFKGPISNEEFDTYVHTRDTTLVPWGRSVWKYQRIIQTAVKVKALKFSFRKLMNPLRPRADDSIIDTTLVTKWLFWKPSLKDEAISKIAKCDEAEGSFIPTRRHAGRLAIVSSEVEIWPSEYTDSYVKWAVKRSFT